ncbi:MAG TPA: hypothetical protein VGR52_04285 [Stellaceae bacterium]|nr:hypothetical protein [Stellaceae bacterium]
METTEKIVEAYVRHVKGWATIANVRCDKQFEIDLLAIDPKTLSRYHIETSVSGSQAYAKLTAKNFDAALLKVRVQKPKMRRTIGYFIQNKFGPTEIVSKLRSYGFTPGDYEKVIVTWGWTPEAKQAADSAGIKLWDFRDIMRQIAHSIHDKRSYFSDDTLRTINLFVRALDDVEFADDGDDILISKNLTRNVHQNRSSENPLAAPFWVYRNWIHQRARLHRSSCSYCKDGKGAQGTKATTTGDWKPFPNEAEAKAFLVGTRYGDARPCGVCMR